MFPVSILLAYCSYFLLNDFKPRLALPKDPDQYRHTKTGKKCRILLFLLISLVHSIIIMSKGCGGIAIKELIQGI